MTSNQIFAAPRFFNLLREETSSGYKMTFIIASVVLVFLSVVFISVAIDKDNADFHRIWYSIVLLGGGFYFTSTNFNELNRKEERMNYLAMPASIFEKFSVKLLISTLGYIIGVTLLYWIFASIMDVITVRYWDFSYDTFNPFDSFYLFMIKIYLVVQSVFLLGAVTFNRFSFFKTLFTLGIIGFVLAIIGWVVFRIVFYNYFDGFFSPRHDIAVMPSQNFQDFMEFTMWPLVQGLFWYVLAPVLWVVAYFKLKEREV